MAQGTTLASLRDQLRAEIGASASPAMGQNTIHQMNHLLNRTQERLWVDFDWPHLAIERDVQMVNGQRYYSLGNDVDFNRVGDVNVKYSSTWRPVEYGIGVDNYNELDPENGDKQDPVQSWRIVEDGNIEVWPTPASDESKIRFKAVKKLPVMSADGDTALLDDKLIVLFASADMLAHSKAPDAGVKLQLANAHYSRLRGLTSKSSVTLYGGGQRGSGRNGLSGGKAYPTGNYGLPGS